MPDLQIPIVDLEDLLSDDAARQALAADALRVAFGDFGLVYIRNHGVDPHALHAAYDAFLGLLARPTEEKRAWGGADIWFQRGWTPPNTEKAVVAGGQPDFKECFFFAPVPVDPEARAMFPELMADNVWPEDGDAFREAVVAIGAHVHRVGLALLRGCARALDLPPDAFTALVEGGPHVTRLLDYLPLAPEQLGQAILWGEEHTDFNLLTLLPGGRFHGGDGEEPPGGGGLFLRTRPTADAPHGHRVRGTPPPGCMVAQVGQQLEILTAGTFLATPHEISTPDAPGWSRTALAHFVHVHPRRELFPLPPFLTPDAVRAWAPPVLAGTYAVKTLVDIGLAPPAALDRFGYHQYGRLAAIRQAERTRRGA